MPHTFFPLRAFFSSALFWALLLNALIVGAFGFVLERERQNHMSNAESALEFASRALEQRTSLIMAYASSDLKTLAASLDAADADSSQIGRINGAAWIAQRFSSPWMRSTSIVDSSGKVIASSSTSNVGDVVDMLVWGGLAQPGQVTVGPVLVGRDLADLRAISANDLRLPVLPLLRSHRLSSGEIVYLVMLINLDYFCNQFNLLMGESGSQIAMLNYSGAYLAGTNGLDGFLGTHFQDLPIFRDFLPGKESGHYQGIGVGFSNALVSFQSVRDVPLILVAQRPLTLVTRDFWPMGTFILGSCGVIVLLITAIAIFARHSARRKMQSQQKIEGALDLALQSKAFHEAIQSSALDAIITIDAHDVVHTFNAAAEQIFGYSASDAIGKKMAELIVPPDLRDHHLLGLRRHIRSETSSSVNLRRETIGQRSDGKEFPIEVSVVSVNIGDVLYFVATIRDISSSKNADALRMDLLVEYQNMAKKLALKNDELFAAHQRELQIGTQIQQTMLVSTTHEPNAGLWLAAYNQASKGIDGDFFGVVQVDAHAFDVLAGDVMGKGVPAALLGAATKLQFNRSMVALLLKDRESGGLPQPHEIVSHVGKAMASQLQALDAFVTLVYIRLDLVKNTVSWVGCGHEETLLISDTEAPRLMENQHPPMGVLLDETFHQSECHFGEVDSLFLASDGASDATTSTGQRVGREVLNATLQRQLAIHKTPSMALHTMRRDLFTKNVSLTDDLTLALLNRYALRRNVRRIELPIALTALVDVRGFVLQRCEQFELNESSSGLVTVAIVEVVTNVIRHAQGLLTHAPLELMGEIANDRLTFECKYIGDYFAPPAAISTTDFANLPGDEIARLPEGGFGLSIIEQVADEVHYLHEDGVNTVRLRLSRPAQI
jgi:PAS domain S-box-containing protein